MTQEALAQGLALQASLGGQAALVAMRFSLENEGAFCHIAPTATAHSIPDAWAVWPLFGNRSKADSLNAVYGAVLGGMAHLPDFHFWAGHLDDGPPASAEAMHLAEIWMPGFPDTGSTDAGWLAPSAGPDDQADWTGGCSGGTDIFLI